MKIHFLKTMWSDMIILEQNGSFALVDTGFDEQYEQLSAYLDKLGVSTIDFILLTHFHRDHYGNIVNLIKNYDVKKVYFKEYGGHDHHTAWGSLADDDYRQAERDKWQSMKESIIEHSQLEMSEGLKEIHFQDIDIRLYSTENWMEKIWEDDSHIESYHQNVFSENQNSLAAFFEVNGKTVLLGGDVLDFESKQPMANYVNLQIAKQINRQIYLYKVPHHGTVNTSCDETLAIYHPQIAVITNGMEWLSQYDTFEKLRKSNPDVEILLTEHKDVVIEL